MRAVGRVLAGGICLGTCGSGTCAADGAAAGRAGVGGGPCGCGASRCGAACGVAVLGDSLGATTITLDVELGLVLVDATSQRNSAVRGGPLPPPRAGSIAWSIHLIADHSIVELLSPPAECAIGERVTFAGHPGEPLPPNQVAKKKVWEAVAPHLGTDDKCVAQYKDVPFGTAHGVCTVATIAKGGIK